MPRTRIGKLHALVTANTERFQQGMRKARRSTKTFQTSIVGFTTKLLKFGTALTGIGGIAGTGFLVRGQLKALDAVAKTSDRLGVQTERLIGLQFAMEQSGGTAEDMVKALERVAVATTEVTMGTGEAKDAYKALRLDAAKMLRLPLDKQFQEIGKAVERIPNATQRMGLLADIFGRRQLKVINLLMNGEDAIEGMVKQAKDLNFVFNRVDLGQIEAANDAMNRARRAFQAIFGRVSVAIAPLLEAAADKLSRAFATVDHIRPWLQAFLAELARTFGQIADIFRIDIPNAFKWFGGPGAAPGIERVADRWAEAVLAFFDAAETRSRNRIRQFNLLGLLGEKPGAATPASTRAGVAGGFGLSSAKALGLIAGAPVTATAASNPLVQRATTIDDNVKTIVQFLRILVSKPIGLL